MLKVKVYYVQKEDTPEKIRSGEVKLYIGFQEVTCHLIFDVNMDFSRKKWMLENRAMNEAPSSLTYYYVVVRESVYLEFLKDELNDMDIMACDVGNEYLNAHF